MRRDERRGGRFPSYSMRSGALRFDTARNAPSTTTRAAGNESKARAPGCRASRACAVIS